MMAHYIPGTNIAYVRKRAQSCKFIHARSNAMQMKYRVAFELTDVRT